MVLYLEGLLPDGSPAAAGVTLNPRKALSLGVGQDASLRLTVRTPSGEAVPLAAPAALVLTVKKVAVGPVLFQRVPTVLPSGQAEFAVTPADTRYLEPGQYVYDVWLTLGGKRDAVVPLSPLHLEASATPPP